MPKKSMTLIDVKAWIAETKNILVGSRITNIYQVGDMVLLKLWVKGREGKQHLLLEPSRRIHLTEYEHRIEQTTKVPPFIAGLRKHIRNAVIEDLFQVGNDRIVALRIQGHGQSYYLIVELIPRGVIVLADNEWKIIYSSEYREMKDRIIKRGEKYRTPPSPPSIEELSVEEAQKLLNKGKDIVRGLVRGWGLPGEFAEEVLVRLGIDKKAKSKEIDRGTVEKILNLAKRILQEISSGRIEAYHIEINGRIETVLPYKPQLYHDAKLIPYPTFNKALDDYFIRIEKEEQALREKHEVEELELKIRSSIEKQKKLIEEYEVKAREYKTKADVLSTMYGVLEDVLSCINDAIDRGKWDEVGNCEGVVGYDKHRGLIEVEVGNIRIEVKPYQKPYDIIREFYEQAKNYKRKAEKAKEALEELERRLNELIKHARRLEAKTKARIRRKEWYEKYHWMITSHGFLVIGGRNIDQNESIVRRHLQPDDIFMHADIHGAPVVVLKTNGRVPPVEDLEEAAVIAGCYSKAWKQGLGYVEVYWVKGSQVSKSPPSGEYLPKGSFMVYGKRNYIRVELRLAVGVETLEDKTPRIITGPPKLVEQHARYYAILVPGDQDPSKMAKRLREYWVKKAPEEEKPIIEALTVEDIRERIPGKSRIIKLRP